jgi:hypothetical protein
MDTRLRANSTNSRVSIYRDGDAGDGAGCEVKVSFISATIMKMKIPAKYKTHHPTKREDNKMGTMVHRKKAKTRQP